MGKRADSSSRARWCVSMEILVSGERLLLVRYKNGTICATEWLYTKLEASDLSLTQEEVNRLMSVNQNGSFIVEYWTATFLGGVRHLVEHLIKGYHS